ncbi:uncharacterized protein LOC141586604 [Silene latifolia]|uniref:uncharacterized protein LOC141586604 n=1 Tax=Silene latifolia TaxID=37657 RepID=UPI003D76ED63
MPETENIPNTVNTMNVDDPLYIHNTDLTGVKLLANLFEGTGYGGWKRSMLIALSAKNKLGFIDGSIPKPSSTSPTVHKWQKCNDIVFSWILNSVSPEIAESIIYSGTAEVAWSDLEERFGQTNGAQLYSVQKKLTEFSQGNNSISTYFTRVKAIWDEFAGMGMNPVCSYTCNCGAKEKKSKFQEYQRAVQFLMGLNDSYAVVRGMILMQNPLPKISVIYNILLQD